MTMLVPFWRRWNSSHMVAVILVVALVGFEIFNYDTTRFALLNLVGGHRFWGMEWASILALAFCGIDFAGLVRLFTSEQGLDEPKEVWLLTGAWFLGASMNATMTWYAVALVLNGRSLGAGLVSYDDMLLYAPIFVAVLVWLARILFIGSISVAADRLLHQATPGRHRNSRGTTAQRPQRDRARQTNGTGHDDGNSYQEDFF